MRLASILILAVVVPAQLQAQRLFERKRPEIIPTDGKMRRGGLWFGLGVTHALAPFGEREEELVSIPDTTYTATFKAGGGFGPYVEVGWFHATRDPVILDLWDLGLAYKELQGRQDHVGVLGFGANGADSTVVLPGSGSFNDRYLGLVANANKFIQTADRQFVQVSLGINADLAVGTSRTYAGDPIVLAGQQLPPSFIGQVHLKAGYGFRTSGRLLVIPTLESPVFSVVPADQGVGRLQWFNTRYRPLILCVRFLLLRHPKGFACPPAVRPDPFKGRKVYKQEGYHP